MSSDADEDAWLLHAIAADFERARQMGLPEPNWLPESTMQWYAAAVGIDRKARPVEPPHVRIRIRRMRQQRRLTQEQLGRKVGLSQASISYIERGKRFIRLEQLLSIAKALDVTVEWLVSTPEEER